MVFQESCILVLWTKVVSALEGLKKMSRQKHDDENTGQRNVNHDITNNSP